MFVHPLKTMNDLLAFSQETTQKIVDLTGGCTVKYLCFSERKFYSHTLIFRRLSLNFFSFFLRNVKDG